MARKNNLSLIVRCIVILFLFPFATVVAQAKTHRTFSTSVTINTFGNAYHRWDIANHRSPTQKIMVPMLEIYSPSGVLIYHGAQDDAGCAAQVLSSLPSVPSPPPSRNVHVSLNDILDISPDLSKLKETILSGHHFTVVSFSVRGKWSQPNAYSVQNHAVDSIPKRPGVDIDVVYINLIWPED